MFGWHVRQWIHSIVVESIIHSETFSAELQIFQLTFEEFERIKIHEHEFALQGEMFDIVWKESNGNTLTLYCYRDTDEEHLIMEFIGLLADKTTTHSTSTTASVHSFLFGFILFSPERSIPFASFRTEDRPYCTESFPTIGQSKRVDIPPPRSLFV